MIQADYTEIEKTGRLSPGGGMNTMKNSNFSYAAIPALGVLAAGMILISGCNNPVETSHDGLEAPAAPVGNYMTDEKVSYSDQGDTAEVLNEYTTPDGLCTIKVTEAYFDVTLDEEKGTPYEAGLAYGTAIREVYPDFGSGLEPYLYENIREAFPDIEEDFSPVEVRMQALFDSIDPHYQEEVRGVSDGLGITEHGIVPDGELSYEEFMLSQIIPDCLRPTACSGLALWGEKTVTGDMMGVRCLEWDLGSDRSMCRIHTVLRIRNHDKSITCIGFLGILDVISGVNDDGIFISMYDSGSDQEFTYEGKTCYSFATRHCLEEYSTARECGEYMVENSKYFTWSHNIMIYDGREVYCAEDAAGALQDSGEGFSALRDNTTPIMKGLSWDSPDSLCVINSFLTEGNYDNISGSRVNAVRFSKYNEFVKAKDKFSTADLKDAMTQEIVETDLYGMAAVQNVHRDNLTQMIIIDYHQGSVQVAFTGMEGVVDKPVFYQVESVPQISCK